MSSSLIFEISVVTQVKNKKQYSGMIPGNNPDSCHVLAKVSHFFDLFVMYIFQKSLSKASQSTYQPLLQRLFCPPRSQLFYQSCLKSLMIWQSCPFLPCSKWLENNGKSSGIWDVILEMIFFFNREEYKLDQPSQSSHSSFLPPEMQSKLICKFHIPTYT